MAALESRMHKKNAREAQALADDVSKTIHMAASEDQRAVVGSKKNFWLYSTKHGYDLTHPATPESSPVHPRVLLQTTTEPIAIDPAKSALVIIDMQNYFLSPSIGKPTDSKGLKASDELLKHAIPACRKSGIQIIWLNWGLSQEDLDMIPAGMNKAFGFETHPSGKSQTESNTHSADDEWRQRLRRGPGKEIGPVTLEDGSKVEGGKTLVRNQWNTQLYPPLEKARQEGASAQRPDVWCHKNRASGMWHPDNECSKFVEEGGIRTLLFAGVNTDQCVGGTLVDAFSKGYDCILLGDGAATTSPDFAQQCYEFNVSKMYGFLLSCSDLAKAVDNMN